MHTEQESRPPSEERTGASLGACSQERTLDGRTLSGLTAIVGIDPLWARLTRELNESGYESWWCRALIDACLEVPADPAAARAVIRDGLLVLAPGTPSDQAPGVHELDQRALRVAQAQDFLELHMQHARDGVGTARENTAVALILDAVAWAQGPA